MISVTLTVDCGDGNSVYFHGIGRTAEEAAEIARVKAVLEGYDV